MTDKINNERVVGQTKDVGFQIGVRKTFDIPIQQAWGLITSVEGINLWLGESADFHLEPGEAYQINDGATGEVRVVKPGSHFRLTWQPQGWQRPSLIQVRVIPSGRKTMISFHQEHLPGQPEREQRRQHWQKVLETLQKQLDG